MGQQAPKRFAKTLAAIAVEAIAEVAVVINVFHDNLQAPSERNVPDAVCMLVTIPRFHHRFCSYTSSPSTGNQLY